MKVSCVVCHEVTFSSVGAQCSCSVRRVAEDGLSLGCYHRNLLVVGDEKSPKKKASKSNGRPAGKVREVFDRVSKLPRRQQEHIVNWVSAYVSQYEQTGQSVRSGVGRRRTKKVINR